MIVSEKSYKNVSDYNQFLFKKDMNLMKKKIISSEKMRNLGNITTIMVTRSSLRI